MTDRVDYARDRVLTDVNREPFRRLTDFWGPIAYLVVQKHDI